MRLIDADELLKKEHLYYSYLADEYYIRKSDIEDAPTIEERKKGRWLNKGRRICCSVCGRINFCKPNFCDECGAEMREEKTDG